MWNKQSQRIAGLIVASLFTFHFLWWLFVAFVSWDVGWVGNMGNTDGGMRVGAALAWMIVTVIAVAMGGGAYELIKSETNWFDEGPESS